MGFSYTGLTFFRDNESRRGWVPVHAATMSEYKGDSRNAGYTTHTRMAFPLRLAFAWTPWKVQGQTFHGKVLADLGCRERDHGLTYTVMSRVTQLRNLCFINGFTFNRFVPGINNLAKMVGRKAEEVRLRIIVEATMEMLGP
jgi:hypothetical protein